MEELLEILQDIDDSVDLISEIEEHFDIEVDAAEMTPENFNSAAAMWKMIQRLQEN